MSNMITIILPWPPAGLSPNATHSHWSQLAQLKRRYKAACSLQASAQGAQKVDARGLHVHLTFVAPDRRPRDEDNMVASMKAGLDGVAEAIGVDDSLWKLSHDFDRSQVGGYVRFDAIPMEA